MRFAIKTRPEHQSWQEIRDIWVAADELPLFESVWNWDHFYPLTGDLTGPNFEAWTMLGAMAAATRRIRIGCQVTGMIYRHPAVLANMAATVDIMAGGRLELGLGAGWNQMECDAYGIDLPPLKERFDRFDEGVEAIVLLLTQPVTNYPGRYVTLTEARCEPKSVQRPHPPITIGGTRPEADAADHGTLGAAVELARPRRHAGVAGPQGRTRGALRGRRQGRQRDHLLGQHPVRRRRGRARSTQASMWRDAGVDLLIVGLPDHCKPAALQPLAAALEQLA